MSYVSFERHYYLSSCYDGAILGRNSQVSITLDPRLPFPDSVGGIFPGPATTQKVYQGIEWFSLLVELLFEHVD